MNETKGFLGGINISFSKIPVSILMGYMRALYRPRAYDENGDVLSKVDFSSPCVVIANHTSHKDAIFLMSALGRNVVSLVARDWYEKPQFKWIMKSAGCIPCDRNGLDTEWIREAVAAVKNGESVLVFPEGRTRKDGEMNEFKSGFAMLAALSGAPVVCIGLTGEYRAFRKTHYIVGEPRRLDRALGMKSDYLRDQSEEFRGYVDILRKRAKEY